MKLVAKVTSILVALETSLSTTSSTTSTVETTSTSTPTPTTPPTLTTAPSDIPADQLEKSCQGKEADIVFIVDMSSSIDVKDFQKQLHFLADIVQNFDINTGKTSIALVTYSDNAETQFYLDDFKSQEEIRKAILAVVSEGGVTNTHLALQKVQEEILTKQHGSRPGVAQICILITDGRSSMPELTVPQAKLVHKAGIYVFAIGVGDSIDTDELKMMASQPEYAFEVDGFNALEQIRHILAFKTCEVPQMDQPPPQDDQPRCTKLRKADILFGLFGISGNDRHSVIEFMNNFGSAFDLQSGNFRFGLIEECGMARRKLELYEDIDEFGTVVSDVMTMQLSHLMFQLRRGFGFTRRDTKKIVILVVSGNVQDINVAYEQARYLKFKATVIVVGVGKDVVTEQLKKLASYRNKFETDISHVFPVSRTDDLPYIVKKLHKLLCI